MRDMAQRTVAAVSSLSTRFDSQPLHVYLFFLDEEALGGETRGKETTREGGTGVDGRITLKWIFWKWHVGG